MNKNKIQGSTNATAYLVGLSAVIFWSMNVIISSSLAGHMSPAMITFTRWSVAMLILLPFTWRHMRSAFSLTAKEWGIALVQASCGVVLFNTLIYVAGETSTAIDMALISTTGPVFMAIFSVIFLHGSITFRQIVGLSCAVLGVFVLLLDGDIRNLYAFQFTIGDIWTLLAAACFALFSSFMPLKPARFSGIVFLELTIIIGIIILLPFIIWEVCTVGWRGFTPTNISMIVYMSIFQSIVAFLSWSYALTHLGNVRAGLLYYTMPIFSSIAAYVFLGEQLQKAQLFGGFLVLIGVIYAALGNKQAVEADGRL